MNFQRLTGALLLLLTVSISSILLAQGSQSNAQKNGRQTVQGKNVFGSTLNKVQIQQTIPAVRNCFTEESEKKLQERNPRRLSTEKFEEQLASSIRNRQAFGSEAVYKIPVIVHVVHNGEPVGSGTNISQEQVMSQFDALNEDYRRMGAGYNEHPSGADIKIEFVPALVDPQGNQLEEPGIDRVFGYNAYYEYDPIELELKPNTIWNPDQYFNIWVLNLGGGMANTLGYAQYPSMSGLDGLPDDAFAETDGIVIGYRYFGRTENVAAPFNMGRTTTHEVGHWLGLRHIWGDGDCSATDYCADTPSANGPNHSCQFRDSCLGDGPDMIENYMDYSNDPCMSVFTVDQMTRMRTVLERSPRRHSLIECQDATVVLAGANVSSPRQWFDYTAGNAQEIVTISSIAKTTINTKLSLYKTCNTLPLQKNDDAGNSLQSELTILLEAGETIKILWEGDESMSDFEWDLSVTNPTTGAGCELAALAGEGTNQIPVTALRTYWVQFTSIANDRNVIIDGNGREFSIYENNCDALHFVKKGTGAQTIYDLDMGENLFVAFEADGGLFDWTLVTADGRAGESCEDAVAAVTGENIIPYAPPFQYWYSYTMPFDGELSIRADHQLQGSARLAIYKSCGGALIKEVGDRLHTPVKIHLRNGETIRILWDGELCEENITWHLEPTQYSNGEVCSIAKVVEPGLQHTDGTFQWFKFTTTKHSNLKISSVGFTYVDTHMVIKRSCDGRILFDNDNSFTNGMYSTQSEIVLHGINAGETFLIGWTEKWSYDGFDWLIEEVEPISGDDCANAMPAVIGTNIVDLVPGHQYSGYIFWTKFTVPANGKKITAFSDKPVDMAIYSHNDCQSYTFVNSGVGKGQALNLPAGTELVIIWSAEHYVEDFTWELMVENTSPGDYCLQPKRATQGENTTPYSPYYYDYVMSQAGSLRVTVPANEPVIINISTGCSYEEIIYGGYNEAFVSGLNNGDHVHILITADYPYHGVTWVLEEIPRKEGDTCADPLPAAYGLNHAEYGGIWYSYTPPTSGTLKISSRAFTYSDTDLFVYDACGGELLAHNDNFWVEEDYTLYFQSEVLLEVEAGQDLLINWDGNYSYEAFNWEIVTTDPRQGDTCEDPLPAVEGINNAMKASPSWFSFTMPETASLTLSSLGFSQVQTVMEVYDGCNGTLLAADDGSDLSTQSYLHIDELAEGQTVLIKCYGASFGHIYTYDWQLFVGDPAPGLFCQYPAQAQVGTNTMPAYTSESYWYSFTMPEDNKKLVITRLGEPFAMLRSIGVTADCGYYNIYSYGEDRLELTGLAAGEQVLIFWNYVAWGERPEEEWELAIVDFGTGDTCEDPLEALPGSNACTGAVTWYSYTLPKDGNVRLASKNAPSYADTYVEVYDACNGNLVAANDNSGTGFDLYSEVLLENLTAGQTLYIKWQTNYPFQVEFDWDLSVEDAANNAPELDDTFLQIVANPSNGLVVGTLQAHDDDDDDLHYRISDGNEEGAFALDEATGVLTIADASQILGVGEEMVIEVTVTDHVDAVTAIVKLDIVTSTDDGGLERMVQVYPNPAHDQLYFNVSPGVTILQSYLLNTQGSVAKVVDPTARQISLSDLEAGVYVLRIRSTVGVMSQKIVVVH